ncbi:putative hemolysin [Alcaligenes faecalis]|uniref:putative hemolysin n=1 Tax=Alcaligenes faecalis TaxID=511 RepID=UPI000F0B1C80|nr:DUF333 domain-containing protein [Alcaligenes faecalis]AYR19260.1 DUF333 domain-containing protein [Alcaligenes faecalis]
MGNLGTGWRLSACANQASTQPPVGMANPASAYCVEKGGRLEIVNTPTGQVGMCTLPDGTVIEEWELMRRDHPWAKS